MRLIWVSSCVSLQIVSTFEYVLYWSAASVHLLFLAPSYLGWKNSDCHTSRFYLHMVYRWSIKWWRQLFLRDTNTFTLHIRCRQQQHGQVEGGPAHCAAARSGHFCLQQEEDEGILREGCFCELLLIMGRYFGEKRGDDDDDGRQKKELRMGIKMNTTKNVRWNARWWWFAYVDVAAHGDDKKNIPSVFYSCPVFLNIA